MRSLAYLSLFGIILSPTFTYSCEYKPFDLEIKSVEQERSISRGSQPKDISSDESPELQFASGVAKDATTVLSDAPFISVMAGGEHLQWNMDVDTDTRLASENSMLEFYGYFESVLGQKPHSKFLTEATMQKFKGISVRDLMNYPLGDNKEAVRKAATAVFGEDIKSKMIDKNSNPSVNGLPYFSRPSFMSSANMRQKFGDASLLACMALAYGRDLYTNTELPDQYKPLLKELGMQGIRASLVDLMASRAIEHKMKNKMTRDIAPLNTEVAGGSVNCSLAKSKKYKLEPVLQMRCPSVVQDDPVIRTLPGSDFRFVQVGQDLYNVNCSLGEGDSTNLSRGNIKDQSYGQLVASLLKGANSGSDLEKKLKGAKDLIANPTKDSKEHVMDLANACDNELTGEKSRRQIASTKKFELIPRHGMLSDASIEAVIKRLQKNTPKHLDPDPNFSRILNYNRKTIPSGEMIIRRRTAE